ncbi:hypothetical protein FH972_005081 [Carpinus fangiana]|uniref:Uncharacterized protein n=1 Tax=Carpinus fangiana TaxID=176857 RepID=A0A5N6QNJ3_9ROSI|nr:hypothetical protein FH972_005081 [Carpinus fangiana]
MWIPKLGSSQLFQIILTQIVRVKYAIRRKKAQKRYEKSSLKKKNFVRSEKFIKINTYKQVAPVSLKNQAAAKVSVHCEEAPSKVLCQPGSASGSGDSGDAFCGGDGQAGILRGAKPKGREWMKRIRGEVDAGLQRLERLIKDVDFSGPGQGRMGKEWAFRPKRTLEPRGKRMFIPKAPGVGLGLGPIIGKEPQGVGCPKEKKLVHGPGLEAGSSGLPRGPHDAGNSKNMEKGVGLEVGSIGLDAGAGKEPIQLSPVKEGKEFGLLTPASLRFGKRAAVTEPIKYLVYQRSRVRFPKPKQTEAVVCSTGKPSGQSASKGMLGVISSVSLVRLVFEGDEMEPCELGEASSSAGTLAATIISEEIVP